MLSLPLQVQGISRMLLRWALLASCARLIFCALDFDLRAVRMLPSARAASDAETVVSFVMPHILHTNENNYNYLAKPIVNTIGIVLNSLSLVSLMGERL